MAFPAPDPRGAPSAGDPDPVAALAPARAVGALLALQDASRAPTRRQAFALGARALDALERLERALAGAGDLAAARHALRGAAIDPVDSGDRDLDGLLLQIETRRAVEEAKLARLADRGPAQGFA